MKKGRGEKKEANRNEEEDIDHRQTSTAHLYLGSTFTSH